MPSINPLVRLCDFDTAGVPEKELRIVRKEGFKHRASVVTGTKRAINVERYFRLYCVGSSA